MFEPLDEHLAPSVRRWQAPSLGADAAIGSSLPKAVADAAGETGCGADEATLRARFEEGRACGYTEGQAAMRSASHEAAARLATALVRERDRRDAAVEEELLALARAMTRLVLRRELAHDPEAMGELVREALAQLPAVTTPPSVRLHPEDAAALAASMAPPEAERLVADASLARGDCRIEAGASIVDAGIDAWVARIVSDGELFPPLDAGPPERAAT